MAGDIYTGSLKGDALKILNIRNIRALERGDIECEVMFEGMDEYVPYLATSTDTAATGQQIWLELQNGKWGEIEPFVVTPEMLVAAREAKRHEINVWRTEQEAQSFTFEWNGCTWNAGPVSIARLSPVVMAAKSNTARNVIAWGDAENTQVPMSMLQLEELAIAMAQAQVERNNMIYQRQREMKEALDELADLKIVREFHVK